MGAGDTMYRAIGLLPDTAVARLQGLVARSDRARSLVRRVTRVGRSGRHRIASGAARGMLIDVSGSRPSYVLGTAEPHIQEFLAQHVKKGDVVLDLGANVGFLTLVAAALTGHTGRVVSYEPFPATAAALRANVSANQLPFVDVVEAAVADEAGSQRLHLNSSDQDASLIGDGNVGVDVDVVTIDSEMRRLGLTPNVVKIDVEGAELAVIHGMRATLATARPIIVCEVHVGIANLNDPVPTALREAGYRVSWLEEGLVDGTESWAPHLVALPDA